MKRLCFIIFAFCIAYLPQQSRSACEECPFPLARIFGRWQSPNKTFLVRITEIHRDNQQSTVAIAIHRTDLRRVVAAGRVTATWQAQEIPLTLRQPDGTMHTYRLSLDATTDELTLDGFDEDTVGGRCNVRNDCFNLQRVPRKSTRLYGADPTTLNYSFRYAYSAD